MSPGFLAAMFTVQAMGVGFCAAMYFGRRDWRFIAAMYAWGALGIITFKALIDRLIP